MCQHRTFFQHRLLSHLLECHILSHSFPLPLFFRLLNASNQVKLKIASHWTFCNSVHPSAFHSKSGSFNSKYHSTAQSKAENQLPRGHSQHNSTIDTLGPRPSSLAASTSASAEISCSTTAPCPFRAAACSAVSPWRRGCEEGGAAAAPRRNETYLSV